MRRAPWASLALTLAAMMGLIILVGCGGGSSTTPITPTTPPPVANTVNVVVNSGPANNAVNFAYVSVQVCNPGSTTSCVTIPDVQVDTGSSGLRILASAPGVSGLDLAPVTGSGTPVYECLPFGADYLWGQVEQADVYMAGEKAANLPIQVISSSATPSNVPSTCTYGGGQNLGSSTALQANGILGVGTTLQDCGSACSTNPVSLFYYWLCSSSGCSLADVLTATQVSNPVGFFESDNNGVILALGSVNAGGAASATGVLTFGIGTQSDNAFSSSANAYALSLNSQDSYSIYAAYNVLAYPAFIDSSYIYNLFLDSAAVSAAPAGAGISNCALNSLFYCTSSAVNLPFTVADGNGNTGSASINIGNGTTLWNSSVENGGSNTAFDNLAEGTPLGGTVSVVLGLPFFYGNTVYVGIAGKPTPTGVPAADAGLGYWAF